MLVESIFDIRSEICRQEYYFIVESTFKSSLTITNKKNIKSIYEIDFQKLSMKATNIWRNLDNISNFQVHRSVTYECLFSNPDRQV